MKCPLVRVNLAVNEGKRALFFPTEILCAVAEGLNDQMLIPPKIFKQLKENTKKKKKRERESKRVNK